MNKSEQENKEKKVYWIQSIFHRQNKNTKNAHKMHWTFHYEKQTKKPHTHTKPWPTNNGILDWYANAKFENNFRFTNIKLQKIKMNTNASFM